MNETSFFDEINAARHKQRKLRVVITVIILLSIFGATGAVALTSNKPDTEIPQITKAKASISDSTSVTPATVEHQPVPAKPNPETSTATASASATASMDSVKAKLCDDAIKGAQEHATSYGEMYFSARRDWIENFRGRYDSAEALESKTFYISHISGLFEQLISRTNNMVNSSCTNPRDVRSILIIPNFNEWQ